MAKFKRGHSVYPERPRATTDVSWPDTSTYTTVTVKNSGGTYAGTQAGLNSAIVDAAARSVGTIINIDANVTITCSTAAGILLKNSTTIGTNWIIIQSASGSLPALGTAITPADATAMPKIELFDASNGYCFTKEASAHHYRLVGLDCRQPSNASTTNHCAAFIGLGHTFSEVTLNTQGHHFILDRCYLHGSGNAQDPGVQFGTQIDGHDNAIIESYIDDVVSNDGEAKSILFSSGNGPLYVRNSFLCASGENIMIGGADPTVHGQIPSDITFYQVHFKKHTKWRDTSGYTVAGGAYYVATKNLFELKNAQRVLLDSCVLENVWYPNQQNSCAVLFTPRQGAGVDQVTGTDGSTPYKCILSHTASTATKPTTGASYATYWAVGSNANKTWADGDAYYALGDAAPNTTVSDFTMVNSWLVNCANAWALSGGGVTIPPSMGGPTANGARAWIDNCLITNYGTDSTTDPSLAQGKVWTIGLGLSDLRVTHCTVATPVATSGAQPWVLSYGISGGEGALFDNRRSVFENNICWAGGYVVQIGGAYTAGEAVPGYLTAWSNNVVYGPWPTFQGYHPYTTPMPQNEGTDSGTWFPANETAVKFTNAAGGDWSLASDSPFKNAGTDGRDCGVRWTELQTAISGVRRS